MVNAGMELQIKRLTRSNNADEYQLYRAALEWDLIHPIVIESERDLKSEYKWKDRLKPFYHQIKNLITFCRRLPVTLLADDVGLWKTISAGLIVSELASRGRLSKVLIVCPKILMPQWQEELDSKFDIQSVIRTGQELIGAVLPNEVGAVITTYNSARIHLDKLVNDGYDMLILDEAHKLRNLYWVDVPPQVAVRFRKALEDRMFKYVLMLTATPIQNRLWDLYSLVDLLTVARGHANPFGSTGLFAQKYIADNRNDARRLKKENQEEFRSVVYGYMSRIRRIDANLKFPERMVLLHNVDPTQEEIDLIEVATKWIEHMNRLVQIGILQSLVSSPEALISRLEHMVDNETIEPELLNEVKALASRIVITSKLEGLGVLIDDLRLERPKNWRVVIFTRWLETQTSIQCFLEKRGIKYGLINGGTTSGNQEMIAKFSKEHPEINVIISTEAGSEGVNLQVANVLVNYDLPWNPMIVEQRIGRVQRLGSNHEKVCIFNIVMRGTFEWYIVWRLMEKLQMASHAIWDVDSLLEAASANEGWEGWSERFEDNILNLVLASLAGQDVEIATRQKEQSISDARIRLEQEKKNIDAMLWWMDENGNTDPECPQLPPQKNSMEAKDFVLAAFSELGAKVSEQGANSYLIEWEGRGELIRFDNDDINRGGVKTSILYGPWSPAFDRLVARITVKNLHSVEDADIDPNVKTDAISKDWVKGFGGILISAEIKDVCRSFVGNALVRVRATVAHDSYERLVEVPCDPGEHFSGEWLAGLEPMRQTISSPSSVWLSAEELIEEAKSDVGIVEFKRFYGERLIQELPGAWNDERKMRKLEDDFTTRYEFSLLGLEWLIRRQLRMKIAYKFEGMNASYVSTVTIIPSQGKILGLPEMGECQRTKMIIPKECIGRCEASGWNVLNHILSISELSKRKALPEYMVQCSTTGKHVLMDETGISSVTGNPSIISLLKKSALSEKLGEPDFFDRCEFSDMEFLKEELSLSEVSQKKYRNDEEAQSSVSGKKGHESEFIRCFETKNTLLKSEAETCETTGKSVIPGILIICEVSGKRVLPSELEKCAVSGKMALKRYMVSSSFSGARLLESEAIKWVTGLFCSPQEAKICLWSGRKCYPDDLRVCHLSWLAFHFEYMTLWSPARLSPMSDLLEGISRKMEKTELWGKIAMSATLILDKKNVKIEAAEMSLDGKHMIASFEVPSFWWLRTSHCALVYSIWENSIRWRISKWKRTQKGWVEED
jgi:superfamily II DNA or RNA helicase